MPALLTRMSSLTDVLDRSGDGVGAGDVEVDGLRRSEGRSKSFGGGEIDVGDPDEGAGGDQLLDGGFADAAGAAGDQGVTAVEAKRLRWMSDRCWVDAGVPVMEAPWMLTSKKQYTAGRT